MDGYARCGWVGGSGCVDCAEGLVVVVAAQGDDVYMHACI